MPKYLTKKLTFVAKLCKHDDIQLIPNHKKDAKIIEDITALMNNSQIRINSDKFECLK